MCRRMLQWGGEGGRKRGRKRERGVAARQRLGELLTGNGVDEGAETESRKDGCSIKVMLHDKRSGRGSEAGLR